MSDYPDKDFQPLEKTNKGTDTKPDYRYAHLPIGILVNEKVRVKSVKLDKDSLTLTPLDTEQLNVIITPSDAEDKDVDWESSNLDVVIVNEKGKVRAVAPGQATITAKSIDGGFVAECQINVTDKKHPKNITLDKTEARIGIAEKVFLKATVTPSNANDTKVLWYSSDTNVAVVDQYGSVVGFDAGKCIITAKTRDNGLIAECNVTVYQTVANVSIDKSYLLMQTDSEYTLNAIVKPSNAENKKLTWSSSDKSVATVDNKGTVKAIKKGTAKITAKSNNGKTAVCNLTVEDSVIHVTGIKLNKTSVELAKGDSAQLTADVTPADATDKTVYWISNDKSVATVDNNGLVKAIDFGVAEITAVSKDGSFVANCKVVIANPIIYVTKIAVSPTTLTLNVGKTGTLKTTVTPSNATDKTVTWSTSNKSIATVDSKGVVKGIKAGIATITVTAKDGSEVKGICKVTVKQPVTKIAVSPTTLTLNVGKTGTLKTTVTPSNATDKTVTWSTSNKAIATVDSKGVVKGIKAGTATITAIAKDGSGKKATCKVTVKQPVTKIAVSPISLTVIAGKTATLKATVSPSNATNKNVTWSTSNKSIATVDSKGVVKGIKAGTATITATAKDGSGKKATCKITVKNPVIKVTSVKLSKTSLSLTKGQTTTLKTTVSPSNATDKTVTWTTSNKSIATVDSKGVVKGIKAGNATITVKTKDGSKTATCKISVK